MPRTDTMYMYMYCFGRGVAAVLSRLREQLGDHAHRSYD